MNRKHTWCPECGSNMAWDDKRCKECGYDGTEGSSSTTKKLNPFQKAVKKCIEDGAKIGYV